MAPDDDFIDPLGDEAAELEARFRAMEEEADLDDLRRRAGVAPGPSDVGSGADAPIGPDPLSDLKAAIDNDGPVETYLLAICPACQTKNRISMTRVRTGEPVCGKCKEKLAAPHLG